MNLRNGRLGRCLLAAAWLLTAGAGAHAGPPAPAVPRITVDAAGGVPIARHLYGANNIWFLVPGTDFDAFSDSLRKNAGVTLLRYPGGFESEHYHWDDNTLDPTYRFYTPTSSATPDDALREWGAGNVAFVVRTAAALHADTPAAIQRGAAQAAQVVSRFADRVTDWEIGNEWFNQGGARKDEDAMLRRYATLLTAYVPAMKQAAAQTGHPIRVYAVTRWAFPGDGATLRRLVPASVWAQVDGLDLHAYAGIDPGADGVPLDGVTDALHQDQAASGKDRLFVSEWAATLNQNDRRGGLQNADVLVQIIGQFARAGVAMAAYWPPVMTSRAQADHITLLHDAPPYPPDADGQALGWLSADYTGEALPVTTTGTTASALAARKDAHTVTVFVTAGPGASDEPEQVTVKGFTVHGVVSARALWAAPADTDSGPAQISPVAATLTRPNGVPTVQFTINPGGPSRGSADEIIELVLAGDAGAHGPKTPPHRRGRP